MIRVAKVTLDRLFKDPTIWIAIFLVPVVIVVLFARLTGGSDEAPKIRIGILEISQGQVAGRPDIQTFVAKDLEDLKAMVALNRVAAGVIFEGDDIREAFALETSVGEGIAAMLAAPAPGPIKSGTVSAASRINTTMNFLVNYMMFSLIFIATDIVSLRKAKILMRYSAMPLSPTHIYGGHLLAFMAILGLQLLFVNSLIYLVIGTPLAANALLGFALLMSMMAIVLGFGLLVTRFTNNMSFVPLISNALLIPLMMASGTFMPVDHHPILKILKYLTPQYWVMDGINEINLGSSNVGLNIMVLSVMAALVFSLAVVGRPSALGENS